MKTQDLKWLAYTRSFTAQIRNSREERIELIGTLIGAVITFAIIWKLINL